MPFHPHFYLPNYLKLFTSQYRLSPNLQVWQTALLTPLDDLMFCVTDFVTQFNLTYAVGAQLDFIGKLIGQSRILPFQPSGGISPILDDDDYTLLLYATQANNNWDGHTASLYSIWQKLFPDGVLVINDNQDMTATVLVSGDFNSIELDLILNGFIVPRPEGVLYTYLTGTQPYFGFDLDTATIAGFDTGHFA